jgi:RNA polymerase sigma-70 factor (ECF subfamily)
MKPSPDYSSVDDAALMRLVALSQEQALAQLYDRYNRLVFSLALAIVQDRATAEEITLDVFMRIWQKAALYNPEQARVSTWLTHITRNHSIDVLRRRAARPEHYSVELNEEAPRSEPPGPTPADTTEETLQRERVHSALSLLPADQRQVLFLAYFEGYTQSQIAETLHQPLGTVKTRMRLALQKLRDYLQGDRDPVNTSTNASSAYNTKKE